VTGPVRLRGHGIHGGRPCTTVLHRRDGPVAFRRAGVEMRPRIARLAPGRRCTVLGDDGVRVATVEHLLAALHVRGVWSGLLIEADADELPILDGSAAPWDDALAELGAFPPPPPPASVDAEVRDEHGGRARLESGPRGLAVEIAFDHPAIGRQSWSGPPEAWPQLLSARTFGFERDRGALHAEGRALGASDASAIVFGDDADDVPLRFPDEPARHKALDALGDLYLLGRPFAGRLRVSRGGHALHQRLVSVASARLAAARGTS
jgi:UDP-3-O-[3-hydroxymyristoyl] N-acetylglucosamine deacetylase